MAKYSRGAGKKVGRAMHEMKEGKLKSGRSGRKVTSPKQAIAIGLSEAREEGAKVPKKKSASKKSSAKRSAPTKRATAKKKAPGKKRATSRKRTTRKKSTSR
ncbi:hypothetical protein A4H97_31435 [Niastella yeongjuensis]|uniref:Histone H1-like protein n=1 Tax=Niastella yeongjuensis TaxID=354355 RepID=A0A1V9EK15_9BACT|nr:DUF6496 domain-containing protein [Niastella yeongjuensis]OQP46274.1 hypothetical protein A4H97_31435 [Niastella yeongjuensis]SEP46347.1 hypothetical protein SAMN05660816_06447 [Niastella yeongjuensis]